MAQLTATKVRKYATQQAPSNELGVKDNEQIFEGSAVGLVVAEGVCRQLTGDSTVEKFAGFAHRDVDNSGGADGDKTVSLVTEPVELDVVGATGDGDYGKPVYASDGDTFSLTQGANDPQIGVVKKWISGTTCLVSQKADGEA